MTLIQVSAWLMVSFGGVFSGAILMVAVEGEPVAANAHSSVRGGFPSVALSI